MVQNVLFCAQSDTHRAAQDVWTDGEAEKITTSDEMEISI